MFVFADGPFYIFTRIRHLAESISEHFGKLFSCMVCFPSNLSWVMSLVDWFLVPQVAFTPFNMILAGTGLWWLAMLMDIGFGAGAVWAIHNIIECFESVSERNNPSEIVEEVVPDVIEADDITNEKMSPEEVAKWLAYKPLIDIITKEVTDNITNKKQ